MRVVNLGTFGAVKEIGVSFDMRELVDGYTSQIMSLQPVVTAGAPSAVTMDIEGSLDGVNWGVIDTHIFAAGELTAGHALYQVLDKPMTFIRSNVSLLTCATNTAQIDTVDTIVAVNATLYTITIDGIAFDYTSDGTATIAEITAGLTQEINVTETNGSVPVTATDNTTSITLTADVAGDAFIASINGNMAIATGTPNVGGTCTVNMQMFAGK